MMTRRRFGSCTTGVDLASFSITWAETSNEMTPEEVDHSCEWVSANGVLSPSAKEFPKHFVGDLTAKAATKNPVPQIEVERVGHAPLRN